MNRKVIWGAVGFLGAIPSPGEKAVANWDEDSITMAVAAGMDCLKGMDRKKVEGLYFASTTQPYLVRQNATIVAAGLDLPDGIATGDFVACTKSGTSALLAALNAVKDKGANSFIVAAADCRAGKPGGAQEHLYGDGAASLMVGNDNVIATFEGSYSISLDFPDRWKSVGDKFERAWEDRFMRDEGYNKIIPQAITGLLQKYKLTIKDFAKIAFIGIYPREQAGIIKKLGADPAQLQPSAMDTVGDTGAASPLLLLVAALEDAKAGDKILVAGYGSGCDVLYFTVTDKIEKVKGNRRGFKKNLAYKKELASYEKYLAFRNVMPADIGMRGEDIPFTALSLMWRDRKAILSMHGSKCKKCGTPQYPPQEICAKLKCGAVKEMEDYTFYDKPARIFTYTADNLAASIDHRRSWE
jgi:3-hydroxy-3-methylglutaryl CoA synthase